MTVNDIIQLLSVIPDLDIKVEIDGELHQIEYIKTTVGEGVENVAAIGVCAGEDCPETREGWLNCSYGSPFDTEKWISQQCAKESANTRTCTIFFKETKSAVLIDGNGKTIVEKYDKEEEDDYDKARAVAYARYCNEPVPEGILR